MQQSTSPALVLVADDNPHSLSAVADTLHSEEFSTLLVNDGESVLDAVRYETPDLILLDALMPGLDGFETCLRLKAEPATRDIPVIFMTSLTETRYRVQGFNVGAVDYVTKPLERAELLARVRTQVSLRRATRSLEEQNAKLAGEIQERVTAERALADTAQRLEQELQERERAESLRVALQEQIIDGQRQRLLELSAPIIPIAEGLLVMPLIGTMDAERASQVLEIALRGASERRAKSLIIDITGIKTVDATIAGMLVQTARGLELLGTRAILTGIRPEVAQMLVAQAFRFDGLVTKATLQAGVEYAQRAQRR